MKQKFLLYITLCLFFLTELSNAQSNRRQARGKTIRITTNLPSLEVSIDEVLVTKLTAGRYSSIEVNPPVVTMQLTSKGHLSRRVILFLDANNKMEHFNLTLPKYTGKPTDAFEPPSPETFYQIRRLPSLCARFNPQNAGRSALCRSRTMIDEYRVISPPISRSELPNFRGPSRSIALQVLAHEGGFDRPGMLELSEKLYAMTGASKMALELNAAVNFFNNQCGRVFELALEARKLRINSNLISILRGGCYELQKNFQLAAKQFKSIIKKTKSIRARSSAFYHLARNLLPENSKNALRVLANCRKKDPLYAPCTNGHLYLLSQKNAQKPYRRTLEVFTSKLENAIAQDTNSVFSLLRQSRDSEVLAVVDQLERKMGPSFLTSWVKVVLFERLGQKDKFFLEIKKNKIFVPYARRSLRVLIPFLNNIKDEEIKSQFLRRLTEFHPKNVLFQWQLSRFLAEKKQCGQIGSIIEGLSNVTRSKKGPLFDIAGRCFMKLGQFTEATYHFKELTLAKPKDWRSFFNYGDSLERQGQLNEARANFEAALKLNPPAEFHDKIRKKISSTSR